MVCLRLLLLALLTYYLPLLLSSDSPVIYIYYPSHPCTTFSAASESSQLYQTEQSVVWGDRKDPPVRTLDTNLDTLLC